METLKELFKQSENGYANYRATFTRIDAIRPIEDADYLVRAVVCGRDVVISKDLPVDALYIYIPCETRLSHQYLSSNSLYRVLDYMLNANYEDVQRELDNGKYIGELYKMGGFFEKNGRVKVVKFRGAYSQGYLASIQSLIKAYPILEKYSIEDFDSLEGVSFDMIGQGMFCEKYLINSAQQVGEGGGSQKHFKKRQRNLKKASILIPGQFKYHYDTVQFGTDYKKFRPEDNVTISVKVHGSSGIFANVLCYKNDLSLFQKMFKWIYRPREYRLLYASRTKIRNEKVYDVPRESNNFYGSDIWGPVRDLLEPFILRGMIVYGEICGYVEGTTKMIQKNHDYGCRPGEWKFMPYRIDSVDRKGNHSEWNLRDVVNWTSFVTSTYIRNGQFDQANRLMVCPILYEGPLGDLYPDIDRDDENWNINLLERMKNDGEILGMEKLEPLCMSKVPREGVVIRKVDDETPRAWKLKSGLHYLLERMAHDRGDEDIEEES